MWLSQQRMRDAAALLAQGFTTKEVASTLAFRHQASFFRKFRTLFGATPTEFREACAFRVDPMAIGTISRHLSETATFLSETATSRDLLLAHAV
jgi:AraC-like DNA-binding protein